jgi:hypothetical protein
MLQSTPLKRNFVLEIQTSLFHIGVGCFMSASERYFVYSPVYSVQSLGIKLSFLKKLLAKGYAHVLKSFSAAHSDSTFTTILKGISFLFNGFRGSVPGLVLILLCPKALSHTVIPLLTPPCLTCYMYFCFACCEITPESIEI